MASNNDNSGAVGLAIVLAGIWIMFVFVFAFFAFVALALTIVSVFAWRKPVKLFGHLITPEEAHQFVGGGVIGAAALPIFLMFCGALFDLPFQQEIWGYVVLGGYILGSVGVGMVRGQHQEAVKKQQAEEKRFTALIEAQAVQATAAQPARRTPARETHDEQLTFRFASWDDEEELKR